MARIVKEEEYNAKRNEILDMALSLIYSQGYEQMAIQDILDGLHISRGALYHYFDSKQALLDALVDRMGKRCKRFFPPCRIRICPPSKNSAAILRHRHVGKASKRR